MSYTTVVILAGALWLAIGLTLSLVMGRRGHDAFAWLVLGTLFGPLSLIFAVESRGEEQTRPELVEARTSVGSGPIDILIGIDGSPEARSAMEAAVEMLGPRLGRLTLATVIPYDWSVDAKEKAEFVLEQEAEFVGGGPRLELLHGRPATALIERAVTDGYDLLVLGTRGAGFSEALLGSTAVDVAQGAAIPVLLVGKGAGFPVPDR